MLNLLLDTRDLIELGNAKDAVFEEVASTLHSANGRLVFTFTHLREIGAPLEVTGGRTVVTAVLNRLEDLPLIYTEGITCLTLELTEAVRTFREGAEPERIDPFEDRMDRLKPGSGGTKRYLNYPLGEIALDMWRSRPDIFRVPRRYANKLSEAASASRAQPTPEQPMTSLVGSLQICLRITELSEPMSYPELLNFADWVAEDPARAPSFCLWWHVREEVTRNTTDRFKDSDLGDLTLLWVLPHTSFATLDRRMRHYVLQALSRRDDLIVPQMPDDYAQLLASLASDSRVDAGSSRP